MTSSEKLAVCHEEATGRPTVLVNSKEKRKGGGPRGFFVIRRKQEFFFKRNKKMQRVEINKIKFCEGQNVYF